MRRGRGLLGAGAALLGLPLLAHADPLNNGALGVLAIAVLVVVGLTGLTLLFTVWSYLRPASRVLYWLQLGLLALSLWAGWWWSQAPDGDWPLIGRLNPLLQLCVPAGAWLNGLRWARRAQRPGAQVLGTAVAVLALRYLLLLAPALLVDNYYARRYTYEHGPGGSPLPRLGYQLLVVVMGLGSWWAVLRQAGPALRAALARPWWQVPAVAAGISLACFYGQLAILLGRQGPGLLLSIPWVQTLPAGLLGAAIDACTGAVVRWLFGRSSRNETAL